MVLVFDPEQMLEVLKDFYRITNIRITVFDDQFWELVSYPEQRPDFCQIIRSCGSGSRGCAECDRNACRIAAKGKSAYIYRCHAGLTEAIMPLTVDSVPVGYLLFGHIFAYGSREAGWEVIRRQCEAYPVDMEKLEEACRSRPQVSEDYIKSAARILHATASYLVLERMAVLRQDSAGGRLDAYLAENFTRPLDAGTICRELKLGRTRLYKLSTQLYGVGPSEHIRDLRIEKARKLLDTAPELSIADIGQECGFPDYNYFISVFTKRVGLSPGKYRNRQRPGPQTNF